MQELKANTAVDVLIGPFMDEDDGKTTEESLTILRANVKLSKLGQTLTQKTEASNSVHDADGYYNCVFDTTDTASEGTLTLTCHMTGALPVRHEFMVLAEAAWDSKYVAKDTGFMSVNVDTIKTATVAASSTVTFQNGSVAIVGDEMTVPNTQKVDVETIKTQAVTCAAGVTVNPSVGAATIVPTNTQFEARSLPSADYVVVGDTIAGVTLVATTTDVTNAVTTDSASRTASKATGFATPTNITAGTVTTVSGNVDGNVGGNVTGTLGGMTAAALKDFFDTDSTDTYAGAVAGSVVKEIADNSGGGTPPTASAIADQVWEEAIADHSGTAGSTAAALAAAQSAGDPWATELPGVYTSGQAGDIIGNKLDVLVSTRAVAGDEMTLADDAITSAKYDESTAFPLATADSSETASNALNTSVADAVAIYNLALGLIDEAEVESGDTTSKQYRYCNRYYSQALQKALAKHPWNEAMRDVTIMQETVAPIFGQAYKYAVPSDSIQVRVIGSDLYH